MQYILHMPVFSVLKSILVSYYILYTCVCIVCRSHVPEQNTISPVSGAAGFSLEGGPRKMQLSQ